MSNLIYLRSNTEPVLMNQLVLGNGKVLESLVFQANSVWYDEQGIIRQFSVLYDTGNYGNYFLMPDQQDKNKFLKSISRDLAEFGIKVAANSIFSGSTVIVDLAKFIFEKRGSLALSDLMKEKQGNSMAYIAPDNNDIALLGLLNIHDGISLHQLNLFIRNDTHYTIIYESSRDLKSWKQGSVAPNNTQSFFFANRQTSGYMKLYTGRRAGDIYEIKAKQSYFIFWDDKRKLWSLGMLTR